MALDKNFKKNYLINGLEIEVDIAPCCWMYDSPFQLSATLKATGQSGHLYAHHTGKELAFVDATEADVDRMVAELVYIAEPCSCGNPRMLVKGNTTNRGEKCEICFISKLNGEIERSQERERKKVARKDADMAMKGYTHKLVAWIHPSRGGSDYMVDVYFMREPTEHEILCQLKASHVKNDYRVDVLPQPTAEQRTAHQAALLKKAGLPADAIGRTIEFNGKAYTIIDVDPKSQKKGVYLKDATGDNFTCGIATAVTKLAA